MLIQHNLKYTPQHDRIIEKNREAEIIAGLIGQIL